MLRRPFGHATVKQLTAAWQRALQRGDGRVVRRITALVLLADQHGVATVAERVGVSASASYAWLQAVVLPRFASLVYRPPPGRPASLTKTQQPRLCALVAAGPAAAGYPTGCWHSALLQDLLQREFGVLDHGHDVAALRRHLGCSYQQARFVPAQRDEARRQHWRTVVWPAIVREARRRGALLLFGDEASFAQWGSLGYPWAPRGQQPLVTTGGKRQGYKVFGLIDSFTGRWFAHGHTGRCTAESSCAFLATVLAATDQPSVLLQDGARDHTAKRTRQFIAAHADRLTVYQLPSSSPDDHPIEHLWRTSKRRNTHNRSFPTCADLTTAVETALASFQDHPAEVKQLMGTYLDQMAALAEIEVAQAA